VRSNVAFYPIDARGLVAQAPLGDATKGSPGGQGHVFRQLLAFGPEHFQGQQETLYTLAADTGGKALLDNNDLGWASCRRRRTFPATTILGYYSTNERWTDTSAASRSH